MFIVRGFTFLFGFFLPFGNI